MNVLGQLQALTGVLVMLVIVVLDAKKTMFRGRGGRPKSSHNVLGIIGEVFAPVR